MHVCASTHATRKAHTCTCASTHTLGVHTHTHTHITHTHTHTRSVLQRERGYRSGWVYVMLRSRWGDAALNTLGYDAAALVSEEGTLRGL